MLNGRWRRIIAIVLVVVAVGYIGRVAVGASSRSSTAPRATQPTVTTSRPTVTTSLPTTTTTPPRRPVARHPLKDAFIAPEGFAPQAVDELLNFAEYAHVRIISTGVNWGTVEPNGPNGPFDWADLDS